MDGLLGVAGMMTLLVMTWIIPENSLRLAPVSFVGQTTKTSAEKFSNLSAQVPASKPVHRPRWRHEAFAVPVLLDFPPKVPPRIGDARS
jgi:hypothetical protein